MLRGSYRFHEGLARADPEPQIPSDSLHSRLLSVEADVPGTQVCPPGDNQCAPYPLASDSFATAPRFQFDNDEWMMVDVSKMVMTASVELEPHISSSEWHGYFL